MWDGARVSARPGQTPALAGKMYPGGRATGDEDDDGDDGDGNDGDG